MAVRGVRLDAESHDLYIDAGGRLEFLEGGDAATAQEIKTRLQFFQGESFADTREGVPWYQEILIKGVDLARVRAIVRQVIQSVPGVLDVPRVDVALDRATRAISIVWTARQAAGRLIRSEDFPPLIVGP